MKEGKHPIVPYEKEWKTIEYSQKAKALRVQGEGLKQR